MKWMACALSLGLMFAVAAQVVTEDAKVHGFKVKSIDGQDVDLAKYKGKVLLVVNVASQCGFTPQYEGLQKLHEEFEKDGLAVLGFPCNQFGKQEPGTEAEIKEFCSSKYGVEFPMFAKVDVNGDKQSDLYKYLTKETGDKQLSGPIKWNFEKFLIGKDGKVAARFSSRVKPESDELVNAIKAELKK